jgi:hypothetical protein
MVEPGDGAFPNTHWSEVARAGDDDVAVRTRALTELLRRYCRPMQVHLERRRRLGADAAEEVVQAFLVSKVIEQDLVGRAERERGRFRTFLLTALDRFASNVARDARVRSAAPLDAVDEPAAEDADDPFDAEWTRAVLAEAIRRMSAECERHARADVWHVFEARVIAPALAQAPPVSYEQLVERLGLGSAAQAFNLLATGKRMFSRALRAVIGEYEKDDPAIEEEVAALLSSMGRRVL